MELIKPPPNRIDLAGGSSLKPDICKPEWKDAVPSLAGPEETIRGLQREINYLALARFLQLTDFPEAAILGAYVQSQLAATRTLNSIGLGIITLDRKLPEY